MENNYSEKIKKIYIGIPNYVFIAFSFVSSGYISYRYLLNQEVYEELHGHYNSPKRHQNRNLKNFHLKEASLRLMMGTFFLSAGFIISKYLIYSEYDNESPNQSEIQIKENKNNNQKESSLKSYNKSGIFVFLFRTYFIWRIKIKK